MVCPENEASLGTKGEIPREFSIPEETLPHEVTPERAPLPSEKQPETVIFQTAPKELKPESPFRVETQIIKEEHQEKPPPLKQKTIKALLMEKIETMKEKIGEEERRKIDVALKQLWPTHAGVCTIGLLTMAATPFAHLFRTRNIALALREMPSNPLFLLSYLTISASKLGTIFFYEKRHNVKFSWVPKVLSLWNFSGGGLAIPIEIASILGESSWLINEIIRRYLTSPLRDLNKAAEDFLGVITRR